MSSEQSSVSSGHPATPEEYRSWWKANTDVPFGKCWCGCGGNTSISRKTTLSGPSFRGEPARFIVGHQFKHLHRDRVHYIEEDCGHDTPCWVWQLKVANNGYGHITIGGRTKLAHRYYYERFTGEIPTGYTIDHLCRVRNCVNPEHMEAVPSHINQRRGSRTILNVELVAALREARACGVEFLTLETLTGIKKRTIIAAVYRENWSK